MGIQNPKMVLKEDGKKIRERWKMKLQKHMGYRQATRNCTITINGREEWKKKVGSNAIREEGEGEREMTETK